MNFVRPSLVALALASTTAAQAQVCSASALSTELQYLRRLSLDLKGSAPGLAELEQVVQRSAVEPEAIDTMLAPAELKRLLRQHVRALVWGNLRVPLEQNFGLIRTEVARPGLPRSTALWIPNRSQFYRRVGGQPGPDRRPCYDDVPQADLGYDASGRPLTQLDAEGYAREGFELVRPYWESDPTARVKVCAFEAQSALVAPNAPAASCATHLSSYTQPGCGCGPQLAFCQGSSPGGPGTAGQINAALIEQALRLADRIADEGRPLSELLTARELEVNGPLAHYLRHQTATTTDFMSRGDLGFVVPQKAFTDPSWTRVTVTGRASGIVTTPFYLLKFASNRARANRFFDAFTCTTLQAPPGGLPGANDPCSREPDLSKRCGCSSCHAALEPAAAAWGRYAERGTFELKEAEFPDLDPTCVADGGPVSARCNTYYRTTALHPAEQPWVGKLKGLLYLEGAGLQNFDQGPSRWANDVVASGVFAQCTVRRFWERLVGRPFNEELPDERALLQQLQADFIASGHDVRTLLRGIVTAGQYKHNEAPIGGL